MPMTLLYIPLEEAEKICDILIKDAKLEIDEFQPVDDETWVEISDQVREAVSPESHDAFVRCFEFEPADGYYFRTSGRDAFMELLDKEASD